MVIQLTKQIVEQMFDNKVFNRGKQYYLEDRVQGVSYNRQEKTWFAEVVGTDRYYVEIDMKNLENRKILGYCDCPAAHTYGTCKHIVALLLELTDIDIASHHTIKDASVLINRMLNRFEQKQLIASKRIPMQVEYYLTFDYHNRIYLELKTGIDHRYVVRDMKHFLRTVLENESFMFTKKFTYDPVDHYFLTQDLEIIQLLNRFVQTANFFRDDVYYYGRTYESEKQLLIPPLSFQSLLEKLVTRKLYVKLESDDVQSDISITYDELPFQFTLSKNEADELIFSPHFDTNTIVLEDYSAIYNDKIFYFPTKEQWELFQDIIQMQLQSGPVMITQSQKDLFFSEVLPVLKDVTPIEMDEAIKDEIVEYPLNAKLYVEKNADSIIGRLRYQYGAYEINPFEAKHDADKIIIRDIEKELAIMALIEEANFRYNGKALFIRLEDDEEVYEFLYTVLPKLNEALELYLTDEIKRLIIEREPYVSTNVSVQTETNLLEISFDISGIDEAEVDKMLQAVIEKKRYYRLPSGAFVSLENDSFQSVQTLLDELNVKRNEITPGEFTLPVYKGMQVDDILKKDKRYDPTFRKLLHRLKSPEEQVYELPDDLQATLRSYQETGFQWFKSLSEYQLGGILADEMGLGKTVQTIAYLLSEKSKFPHLVVVPSSVVYNWRNEFKKFAPTLRVELIVGKKEERMALISSAQHADVWITSYGTLRQDVELYEPLQFQTLILDEAQFIKNYATKTSKAIRKLTALKRFALSGTPIENSLHELWAIFQVVLPGLLPNQREFLQLSTDKIAKLTKPFILRRLKNDVLKELPEKIETVHYTELTTEQKELYVGYLQQLQREAAATFQTNQFHENRMKILAGLTRLRQLCCHPSLFIENYEGESGKLTELIATVKTFIENGRRMLIFSQFTSMHELIIKELEEHQIEYFYLHGQTPAKDRVEMSEAFNSGEKDVFLISLRAGGTGLNLTGADTVILYDLWWNPAVEDQATGRAHRYGQKNIVHVIRMIAEGTIEEKIYELQKQKRELIDEVIKPGETMLQSLNEEEIRELLNI